jgi:hypothetical protein
MEQSMTRSLRVGVRLVVMALTGLCSVMLLWWGLGMMASGSTDPKPADLALRAQGGDILLVSAVHLGLEGLRGQDEGFRLVNIMTAPLVLTDGWRVQDDRGNTLVFPSAGVTVAPGTGIWCARNALSFTLAFGHAPALEYGVDSSPDVPNMQSGGQFQLADDGGSVTVLYMAESDTANPTGGPWPAGSDVLGDRRSMERVQPCSDGGSASWQSSVITTVGLDSAGHPITGTPGYTNSAYGGSPGPTCPAVVINEVAWAGTGASSSDEWMELYNNTDLDISLDGWLLAAADGTPTISLEGSLSAHGFFLLERTDDTTVSDRAADQVYVGALENTGETLLLHQPEVIDVVVYGGASPGRAGWKGAALERYTNGSLPLTGQILFRKANELTGLPAADTDEAVDWGNSRVSGSILYGPVHQGDLWGKQVVYPGWDRDDLTHTLAVTATARVTVGIAPDNAYAVVADVLNGAQHTVVAEGYTFESVWLTHILTERIAAGVQVTVLLDGAPAGGIPDQELWNAGEISAAGGRVYFSHGDSDAGLYRRYASQHAKFLVVDDRWAAVSSENWGNHSMPVDDKANGTAGDRGVVLVTDQAEVVRYIGALFARDCDPEHHRDLVAYGTLGRYTVPPTYTAVYSTGGGYEYAAPFSATMPSFATDALEVVHAPEVSLGYRDGLIGLVMRAGRADELYVEQLDEPLHWGSPDSGVDVDPNPRLEAYIEAARRGARVRILLDNGFDDDRSNYESALYALAVAGEEGLDLDVRLGNPTGRGIHNKMVLVQAGGARYAHVGSLNGSEVSSKANRELALQVRSYEVYEHLRSVFDYDWAHSRGPYEVFLPIVFDDASRPSDHVLISEAMFKQGDHSTEQSELGEWIEVYNPTDAAVNMSGWLVGDAVRATDFERMYAFPQGTVIDPQGTLVIARRASAYRTIGYVGKPLPDLEMEDSLAVRDMVRSSWGTGDFALGNEGDEVVLTNATRQVVDVLVYGRGTYPGVRPYDALEGVYNGDSLERYPANRDTDDCAHDFRVRYEPGPGGVVVW